VARSDFLQLDTWIVIHPDNTATFFVGKTDGGQGTGTAFRQMMSDELDIAYDQTRLVMGRTDNTPDQGGSGGSDAIERDGWPMRRVAAEARRVLLSSVRALAPGAALTVTTHDLRHPMPRSDVRRARHGKRLTW
jgi:nicotinate dehydrogenase subunit B